MIRHFVPFRQVIFRCGQAENEIYLLTGQVDFNFFSRLVSEGPSASSFLEIELSFSHFLQSKQVKRSPQDSINELNELKFLEDIYIKFRETDRNFVTESRVNSWLITHARM